LLLGYGLYRLFSRPDDITPAGQLIADAIALDSQDFFRPAVLEGTEGEASKFFDEARTALSDARSKSPTKAITAQVIKETGSSGSSTAEVLGIFKPLTGFVHERQIADAANDQPGEPKVLLTLWLARDPSGTWKLDGKKTLESLAKR
jgi:hypothetical protein